VDTEPHTPGEFEPLIVEGTPDEPTAFGHSATMRRVEHIIRRVAETDAAVLISDRPRRRAGYSRGA